MRNTKNLGEAESISIMATSIYGDEQVKIVNTFKPTSGCEVICRPTSSRATSLTDIEESQNLPSTAV